MSIFAKTLALLQIKKGKIDILIVFLSVFLLGGLASSFSATGDWQLIAAGLRALAEGNVEAAYKVGKPGENFVYLPTVIILAPFAFLPWGKVLWITISGALFGLGLWRLGSHRTAALWMVHPYVFLIALYGQTTLAVGGLIALALSQIRNRCELAGVLLGLALSIKPHLVVGVLPALLGANRRRAVFVCAAVWLGVVTATLVQVGLGGWRAWLANVETQLNWVAVNQLPTTSYDVLRELLGAAGEVVYSAWCVTALAAVWLVSQYGGKTVPAQTAGLASLTVTPYSVAYDYALLGVVAATTGPRLHIGLWLTTAGLSTLGSFFQDPLTYELAWIAIVFALSAAIICNAYWSLKILLQNRSERASRSQ